MASLLHARQTSPLSVLFPASLVVLLAGALALEVGVWSPAPSNADMYRPALVTLPAGRFVHRLDGDYYRNGYAIDAPRVEIEIAAPLDIMKFPVTATAYDDCVAELACPPREPGRQSVVLAGVEVPATGVSHDDALAYARWLSSHTGDSYSLPTDAEWAYAAGSSFVDDALGIDPDNKNPALRWLADYNRETERKAATDPTPKPLGHYGVNENGLSDMAGNVWEWTDTCQKRVDLEKAGTAAADTACGIFVAEGRHRTALSSFVRDPKTGGCSVGAPPDNLGFRLVRRPGLMARIGGWFRP